MIDYTSLQMLGWVNGNPTCDGHLHLPDFSCCNKYKYTTEISKDVKICYLRAFARSDFWTMIKIQLFINSIIIVDNGFDCPVFYCDFIGD